MASRFIEAARRGFTGVKSVNSGGYGGSLYGTFAGWPSGLDYNREAGQRWDSSIVYPLLHLLSTTLTGIPIVVVDAKGDPIDKHAAATLLDRPNPWHDGSLLETASIFCEASRGNSYCYKHRSAAGKLVALEFLAEGACYPYTQPGSGDWISCYRIATSAGYVERPVQDVLHLRWMTPNPYWPQIGMSPLESCLPDLVADKLAARHEASLLRNSAVSSVMVTPKPMKVAGEDVEIELDRDQREQIQNQIDARLSGDSKGSSFIWNIPMEISQLGFDPKQLALIELRSQAESRIAACFNIPPVVAGFLVGLEKSNNRASYEGAVDQFLDGCAIPYMRHRARQLSDDLLPELGNEGERIVYDEKAIPALRTRLIRSLIERTGGPIETPNEGRAELGLKPIDDGDQLRATSGMQAPNEN